MEASLLAFRAIIQKPSAPAIPPIAMPHAVGGSHRHATPAKNRVRRAVPTNVARANLAPDMYPSDDTSKFFQYFSGRTLVNRLPLRREDAVTVFLSATDVFELLRRRRVVDVAVRITRHERQFVRR